MKIQSINSCCYIPSYKGLIKKRTEEKHSYISNQIQTQEIPHEIAISGKKEDVFFNEFLNKKGKVTKKEYDEIIKKHPSAIVKAYKYIEKTSAVQASPSQTAKAALKLKEKYDKEYKGKYLIASIGTSPSPITEVMSALGTKVAFIPASGLNTLQKDRMYIFRTQYPTTASRQPNVKYIIDYTKKHLSELKKGDFLVLLDYCCSGASLDTLCQIFEEENIYKPEQIHDRSILTDLCELSNLKDQTSIYRLEDHANIAHDMQCSAYEEVSNVPHFHVYDHYNEAAEHHISSRGKTKRQLFKEFDTFSKPTARAYSLCAIHEAMKIIEKQSKY